MTNNSVSLKWARRSRTIGAAIAALVVLSTAGREVAARHVVSFEAIRLGLLGVSSEAFAVSANGLVVGRSSVAGDDTCADHAVVWSADGVMTDLHQQFPQTLTGGNQSRATVINDNGVIAGFGYLHPGLPPMCQRQDEASHAFVFTPANGLIDLSTLGGFASVPTAINSKGDVVGYSFISDNLTRHAFLWTARDGVMHDLGTLTGGGTSMANAISDDGVVVGESASDSGFQHAFRWTPRAHMVDLGALGFTSSAQEVNDNGVIVGVSQTTAGPSHAFVWTRHTGMVDIGPPDRGSFGEKVKGRFAIGHTSTDGTMQAFVWTRKDGVVDLGTLDDDLSSLAVGINDRGVVAGNSFTNVARAFVWSASTGMVPLPTTPPGNSSRANGMNDNLIVGAICDDDGTCHATLWKPSSR